MNKYLKQLVDLSNIDKEIDSFVPRIEKVEKAFKSVQEEKDVLLDKIKGLEEDIKEANLKKKQHDLHLAELSEKLKNISKKSATAKNEKEIKALGLEEEIAKEQCDYANEEIVRLEKVIEQRQSSFDEVKEVLNSKEKKIKSVKSEIETELKSIEKERKKVYEQKEKLISQMSTKILTFYEKIRKWAGNTAVVPVKKQACYGCFMRIYDKTYSAVIKSEDIVTCPHCGRILYKEAEENTAKD